MSTHTVDGFAQAPAPLAPYDVVVVGGGPAGLAAALAANEAGAKRVLLLERNDSLGGILNQCIHAGFGLQYFGEELTGPEYAARFMDRLAQSGVEVLTGAMVLSVSGGCAVHAIHAKRGYLRLNAGAVVLAMGCRERTRGAIGIPGSRPAGVLTAGAAQLYMNMGGYQVGRRAVVLGSGDIGLIMARRMTLEGATVLGVFEAMPYPGGLARNIAQCLHDYDIPLHLSHTVTQIRGDKRLREVVVQRVDAARTPIAGSEQVIACDTLLLSVGLIPENELSRAAGVEMDPRTGGPVVFEDLETSMPGLFACGNVAHVHDLADDVTVESLRAGAAAAAFAAGRPAGEAAVAIQPGAGVRYTVPQRIRPQNAPDGVALAFRVAEVCRRGVLTLHCGGAVVGRWQRQYLAPGEMQHLTLSRQLLQKIEGEATLSLAQEEQA